VQVWVSFVVIAYAAAGTLTILFLLEPIAYWLRGCEPRYIDDPNAETRQFDPQTIFEARPIPPNSRQNSHKEGRVIINEEPLPESHTLGTSS
jgi:hypothetical protein